MKKLESSYRFESFYDDGDTIKTASVTLHISHLTKTYCIKPFDGRDGFKFITTSHKWKMWKAILKCIDDAIDFANKELQQ